MKKKPNNYDKARKEVEHQNYLFAVANGQRPPRAATFTDRRKEASRKACRNYVAWQ